jgi:hypothetical protein
MRALSAVGIIELSTAQRMRYPETNPVLAREADAE